MTNQTEIDPMNPLVRLQMIEHLTVMGKAKPSNVVPLTYQYYVLWKRFAHTHSESDIWAIFSRGSENSRLFQYMTIVWDSQDNQSNVQLGARDMGIAEARTTWAEFQKQGWVEIVQPE